MSEKKQIKTHLHPKVFCSDQKAGCARDTALFILALFQDMVYCLIRYTIQTQQLLCFLQQPLCSIIKVTGGIPPPPPAHCKSSISFATLPVLLISLGKHPRTWNLILSLVTADFTTGRAKAQYLLGPVPTLLEFKPTTVSRQTVIHPIQNLCVHISSKLVDSA